MVYKNNKLYLSDICLIDLVENYKVPLYVYSQKIIHTNLSKFENAFNKNAKIFFALKSNSNKQVLDFLKKQNVGIDAVSLGEVKLALLNGFAADKIIFSGVGKTKDEIEFAIKKQIYQISVESPQELERVGFLADKLRKNISIGFRFNPNVNPDTHSYITTGFRENKFGMDSSFIPALSEILKKYNRLNLKGVALHIGSQLLKTDAIGEAIRKTIPIYKHFKSLGHDLSRFNVGGGVGIKYRDADKEVNINEYGKMVLDLLKDLGCDICCEPGRYIVGNAGVLVAQIQYVKTTPYKNFLITDTGMHHFLRPALYGAYHDIKPLVKTKGKELMYDVVGPICESSDFLGKMRVLTGVKQGDFLAIANAGAYGCVMSNSYNEHPRPKEIFKSL